MSSIGSDAVATLIAEHGAALVLYARQWCRSPDDAVQEAFVDLVRLAPAPDRPVAWLFVAVKRRALNQARGERRRQKWQRLAAEEREAWFCIDHTNRLAAAELEALLAELPATDREIVVSRVWGGLTFEEIAELVAISPSAVYRRYRGALASLEARMNPDTQTLEVPHDQPFRRG